MPSRDDVQDALQRTALAAVMYYPEIHVDEPDYVISNDIDWCVEPIADVGELQLKVIREVVGRTIANPSEHRQELFFSLTELMPDEAEAD